jgi:HTH-type transcriptional regulator/antitoxin HigA
MKLKPIHSKTDHKAALAEIKRLWDAAPGTPEFEKLEVLATLVDAYERANTPILPPDPIEAIKFRLEHILGTRARVAEVLNGRRRLTLAMIRALHRQLAIPLEVLIEEPSRKAAKKTKAA